MSMFEYVLVRAGAAGGGSQTRDPYARCQCLQACTCTCTCTWRCFDEHEGRHTRALGGVPSALKGMHACRWETPPSASYICMYTDRCMKVCVCGCMSVGALEGQLGMYIYICMYVCHRRASGAMEGQLGMPGDDPGLEAHMYAYMDAYMPGDGLACRQSCVHAHTLAHTHAHTHPCPKTTLACRQLCAYACLHMYASGGCHGGCRRRSWGSHAYIYIYICKCTHIRMYVGMQEEELESPSGGGFFGFLNKERTNMMRVHCMIMMHACMPAVCARGGAHWAPHRCMQPGTQGRRRMHAHVHVMCRCLGHKDACACT